MTNIEIKLLIPIPQGVYENLWNHYAQYPNDLRNCTELTQVQKDMRNTFLRWDSSTHVIYDETEFNKLPIELQAQFNKIFDMYGEI